MSDMKKLILAFGLLAAPSLGYAKAKPTPKVTMAEATRTALAKVEHGTIKSSELEEEKGKLIYSFDIVGADKQIVEVNVDALTGAVVSVENESADKERAEEQADKKKSPKR
jgi:uncharacterized membrane protein YkoI